MLKGTSWPFAFAWGGRPGEKIRSLVFWFAPRIVAIRFGVGTRFAAAGCVGAVAGGVGCGAPIGSSSPGSSGGGAQTQSGTTIMSDGRAPRHRNAKPCFQNIQTSKGDCYLVKRRGK